MMIQTSIGLPNTCAQCGKSCIGAWWAESVDAARSGDGRCEACANPRLAPTDQPALVMPDVPTGMAPAKRRRQKRGEA